MVSVEAKAELERLFAAKSPDPPLPILRREWEAAARLQVLPKESRFSRVTAGDVSGEWMDMPRVARDRVFLLLHGGGYNAGSPRTHRKLAAHLSRATHMRVLTPDYRLAPEHPFPAAVKDALAVYGWLLGQGIAEEDIVIGGDSAGGGLALSMLLALREAGAKLPQAAVLMSPWVDLTTSMPSHRTNRKYDPCVTREDLRQAALWYAGERDPAEPMLSPLFADLSGLPPMLIHAAADEVMVDEARLLAERAVKAGVAATLKVFDGVWHAFHGWGMEIPESRQAIDEIGTYLRMLKGE
jgi:monoterpene epsilon-lactone hydrolase